jgi:bacterioferritin (cytochrome b1)
VRTPGGSSAAVRRSTGILAEGSREKRERIVEMLTKAYWMEIETVMSYLAGSVNPDGVRAQEIIEATEGSDPVTSDMMIAILHDEEGHRRLFEGFLREYEDQS